MQNVLPPPINYHSTPHSYVPNFLSSTGYVYVRVDGHRHPLQRPYIGPFRIISTSSKYFTLDINGRLDNVSIDRIKPAFAYNDSPKPSSAPSQSNTVPVPTATMTRCGRTIRPSTRFTNDYVTAVASQNTMPCWRGGVMWRLTFYVNLINM